MSMQPMFTIQSSASSSFTSGEVDQPPRAAAARASRPEARASGSSRACASARPSGRRTCPPAVGVALHRERPVAQVRHEHRRDVAVVGEQVALRDPLVRPERLVEVRELQQRACRRGAPPSASGSLAAHLLGGLVLAQPLVRRARAGGRRASTRRTRPRATSSGSTQTTSPLRTRGIFGASANGDVGALERPQQPEQPLDLVVVEAGADVADLAQLAALVDAEHERAEAAGAAALPLRVAGDHELLAAVRLDLEPVAACAGPAR